MSLVLVVAVALVAVAAAVRSTWSPCGLSMLSTITPFSERGRGHSYRATASWFVAGAVVGGASLGLVMAVLALGVGSLHLSPATTGTVGLLAALVAAGSDSGIAGARLPYHRRQVNERWLDRYRPWVYGAGFGWQIGCGLATYVTSAAVYLMIVLGALTGHGLVALAVGTGFGLLRGTAVLLTRRLTDPVELRTFHRRFFELGPVAGRLVIGAELASAALMAWWVHSPAAVVAVGLGVAASGAGIALVMRRGSGAAPMCPVPSPGGSRDVLAAADSHRPAR